ncbi:MAG: hypothetical protein E7663_01070 [Ruminococcaceae bacterium]|nr:hypothetical protein [Oscillospiraceae bacterium]
MPKPFLKLASLLIFGIYGIYTVLLVPAYQVISSDFVLMNTLWFDLVDMLMQWGEVLGICTVLTFLIAAAHQCPPKESKPLYYLIGGALLLKYAGSIIALSAVYGSFDLTLNYSGYIISLLLETAIFCFTVWKARTCTVSYYRTHRDQQNAAATLGKEVEECTPLLPFARFFDRTAPLQRAAMLSVGVTAAARLLAFIIDDIAYSMAGAIYTAADIPVTLLYWLLHILIPCFLGYLLVVVLTKKAFRLYTAA